MYSIDAGSLTNFSKAGTPPFVVKKNVFGSKSVRQSVPVESLGLHKSWNLQPTQTDSERDILKLYRQAKESNKSINAISKDFVYMTTGHSNLSDTTNALGGLRPTFNSNIGEGKDSQFEQIKNTIVAMDHNITKMKKYYKATHTELERVNQNLQAFQQSKDFKPMENSQTIGLMQVDREPNVNQ